MSEPQIASESSSGAKTSALKLPPPATTYSTLPVSVDHRTYLKGCIEVHSQGQCGWCTAHSTTAALEAMLCKDKQTYRRISEPHLWWLGKERGEFKQCKGGWHISSAFTNLGSMTDQGFLLARGSIWPYSPNLEQMNEAKPTNAELKLYGQYGASKGKIYSIPSKSVISLKTALASGYNVVYSVATFKDTGWKYWDDDYGAIVAPSPAPKNKCKCEDCPNEKHCLTGHHAILFVGYDDADGGWFYFLNSWGKWWGNGGFGKIAYDVISNYGYGGRYATAIKTKQVPNKPPVALLRYNTVKPGDDDDYPYDAKTQPDQPLPVGTSIYLSSKGSHDPEKEPISREWSVTAPDGSAASLQHWKASEKNLVVADQVGTYTVALDISEQAPGGQITSTSVNIKVNDPSAPDAAIPDLPPADTAQDTASDTKIPDAPLGPANNATCGSPKGIQLSTSPVTLSGSTKGAANEFGDAINCGTGLTFDAPQRYFRAALQAGTTYTVSLESTGWDAALYIFWDTSCSVSTINKQCASYISDTSSGSGIETLTVKPSAAADFVFVVDSFDPASSGPFSLTLSW
jgi:hypothetical protein